MYPFSPFATIAVRRGPGTNPKMQHVGKDGRKDNQFSAKYIPDSRVKGLQSTGQLYGSSKLDLQHDTR